MVGRKRTMVGMTMLSIIYTIILMINCIGAFFAEEYASFGVFLLVAFTGLLSLSNNKLLLGIHIVMLCLLMVYSVVFAVTFVAPAIQDEEWGQAILRIGVSLAGVLSFLFTTSVFVMGLTQHYKHIKEPRTAVPETTEDEAV